MCVRVYACVCRHFCTFLRVFAFVHLVPCDYEFWELNSTRCSLPLRPHSSRSQQHSLSPSCIARSPILLLVLPGVSCACSKVFFGYTVPIIPVSFHLSGSRHYSHLRGGHAAGCVDSVAKDRVLWAPTPYHPCDSGGT